VSAGRRAVLSIDLDEWYHCRWATGSVGARWPDTSTFFREHYGSDRPKGELREPTRRLLDLLDRRGIRATVFVLGEVATHYPDLVREILARGHEIGCHGLHHVDADVLGPDGFRRELTKAHALLADLTGIAPLGYRAPNLLLRDWMIPVLRELAFRYDASVCTARSLLGKDFGHAHLAVNPYRFRDRFGTPDPQGDLAELPLPVFPLLRLPATTGILTRIVGVPYTLVALRAALRTGDVQYYFHPYEMGPRPNIPLRLRERLFLRRLGGWMEKAVETIVERLEATGARFVTGRDLALSLLAPA
jgi:peptidoglycan-N-acetylglucosamine deacetylase